MNELNELNDLRLSLMNEMQHSDDVDLINELKAESDRVYAKMVYLYQESRS